MQHQHTDDESDTFLSARTTGKGRTQLRQPRLAEMVADILRERIVGGALIDGDNLPKQEDLLEEFSVSKPSIREALRILETEGLISVRRGNLGGAVVHVPQSHDAAYMLGLVLQSKHVALDDVGVALLNLEPACAALCTERDDRATFIPYLRMVYEHGVAALGNEIEFVLQMRLFHEAIVSWCGNETMKTVVGALENLWSAKEKAWARAAAESGAYPDLEMRESGLKAHARILALMEKGDAEGVTRASYRHLCVSQTYALSDGPAELVDAMVLRRVRIG